MPTDQDIKNGIYDNAYLEVAKKLKLIYAQLKEKGLVDPNKPEEKEPDAKAYLALAEKAIKERKLTIPGLGIEYEIDKNDEADDLFKEHARKDYEKLGGKLNDIIPKPEELDVAAGVAIRSVKKATGPITVMGTSLFTLITSFFQAIGDLFSGKIEGGIGGFFGHVKKLAAENTGADIGNNLETGLEALAREGQKNGKFKWLTPEAIRTSVDAAKSQALIAAGVAPKGKEHTDILNELDTNKESDRLGKETAEAKILRGVENDMLGVTKGALRLDGTPSTFTIGKRWAGFEPNDNQAFEITNTISRTVTKLVTDKSYVYDGKNNALTDALKLDKNPTNLTPALFKDLLEYETEKALKETRTKNGFFGYDLTDQDITNIVKKIPGYVDKNYDNLKEISRNLNGTGEDAGKGSPSTVIATAPTIPKDKVAELNKALEESFEKPLKTTLPDKTVAELSMRQIFVDGLNKYGSKKTPVVEIKIDDPYVNKAKAKFAAVATEVIAANPRLLDQEAKLSEVVLSKMLKEDPQFLADSFAMLKSVGAPVGNTPNADRIIGGLKNDFTALFKNPDFRKIIVNEKLVTTAMIDADKKAAPAAGEGTGTPAAGDGKGTPTSTDNPLNVVRDVINDALQEKFADSTPAKPNPTGEMFTKLTTLSGTKKATKLGTVATEIINSGVISTDPNDAKAVFVFDGSGLTFKDPELAKNPTPQKIQEAFKAAKKQVADSLSKDLDPTMNNALAEGVVLEMLDQALPADQKLIDPKTRTLKPGLAGTYAQDQIKVAQVALESEIKTLLNTKEAHMLINYAAAGTNINDEKLNGEKGIVKTISKTMAELLAEGVRDPNEVKDKVGKALLASGAITDPRVLTPIVDMVGKEFASKIGSIDPSKPVTAPDPQQQAIDRALAVTLAKKSIGDTVGDMVNKSVETFAEQAKSKLKEQPLYVAPDKWVKGTKWFARMIESRQHKAMDYSIENGVNLVKNSIDRGKLSKVITDSVVAAAETKYPNPDGTQREFYQLSESEKKDAIGAQVEARLNNPRTYASIFPTSVPGVLGSEMALAAIKPRVISEVVGGIKKDMTFASAPAQPRTDQLANGFVPTPGIPGISASRTASMQA